MYKLSKKNNNKDSYTEKKNHEIWHAIAIGIKIYSKVKIIYPNINGQKLTIIVLKKTFKITQ